MSAENSEIKVVSVDKDAIKVGLDKKDFCTIPFKLSAKPDETWEKKFYEVQQKDKSAMKRKAHLMDDAISVEVSSIDDLQKVLDAVKIEVAETNVLCEADHQTKMKIRAELEALQQKRRDATQKFKEDSDKLVF
jgi:uncharacterized protein YajQ (UPF0234 family)